MKIFLYIFVPILLITLYNCVETSNPLQPQSTKPRVFIKSIDPSQLQVGMDFRVVVGYDNGNPSAYGSVVYNNGLWHDADSINGDTIYSYIPYLHFASPYRELRITASFDNINYYDVDTVYVFPNTCLSGICVGWNDLKTIKEEDSYSYSIDGLEGWLGEIHQDTVRIWRRNLGCDEGSVLKEIKFLSNGSNILPELLSLKVDVFCWPHPTRTDSLRHGLIKIQEWSLNGVVSGYVFSELLDFGSDYDIWPKKIVFWFDFSN